jgi:hypothetical protein
MERRHFWSSVGGKVYVYSEKLEQIVGLSISKQNYKTKFLNIKKLKPLKKGRKNYKKQTNNTNKKGFTN